VGRVLVAGEPRRFRALHEAERQVGELGDLLFPFGLERHRAHDEHAGDAAQLAEERTGRHRLRRLAETHLVPEQRALSERQMQHAVDLVRIEGQLERGEGTTATTAS